MTATIKDYLKEYMSSMAKAQQIKRLAETHGISPANLESELQPHLSRAAEVESFISAAENVIHREVLTRKYIYGETNEQIAEAMCYSPRHIARLLSSATAFLSKRHSDIPS